MTQTAHQETAHQAGRPANDPGAPAGGEGKPARDPKKVARRKRQIIGFASILAIAGGGWWTWTAFLAPKTEKTNNAYTNVEVAQVTPLSGGPVKAVYVVNTQPVQGGQVLFVLDDTDQRLAVNQAAATLEAARRKVRQLLVNDASLAAQVSVRQAAIQTAQAGVVEAEATLEKANLDATRRKALASSGWISHQELTNFLTLQRNAQAGLAEAKAKVSEAGAAASAAIEARQANRVLFDATTVETNPEVLAAKAKLDAAMVDLDRTVIRAPVAGVIDQRKVDVGQRVQAGAPVMVVAPINSMYVDANFKEGQLRDVRPGQPVTLTSDLYGKSVVYHGHVQGFAGGSGSAFAAIPAQNATGNWIKVVQRLPTRIALDPKELRRHPLRVGLSMTVTVDTSRS
jgi:membrane fusion protein (multidrug efflux system)